MLNGDEDDRADVGDEEVEVDQGDWNADADLKGDKGSIVGAVTCWSLCCWGRCLAGRRMWR